jgi:hypothetical protein
MGWFQKMCNNVGLMFHNAIKPLKSGKDKSEKTVVKKTVEEEQVDETTILRRTTIEEIEIKKKKEE